MCLALGKSSCLRNSPGIPGCREESQTRAQVLPAPPPYPAASRQDVPAALNDVLVEAKCKCAHECAAAFYFSPSLTSISPQATQGGGCDCACDPLRSAQALSSRVTSWQSHLWMLCQLPPQGAPGREEPAEQGRHLGPQVPACPFRSGSPQAKGSERRLGALGREAAQPWPSRLFRG